MNKVKTAVLLAGIALMISHAASAQESGRLVVVPSYERGGPPAEEGAPAVRRDFRSLKKQMIAANIELTDDEAQAFWPIYDRYTSEMTPIMDRKFQLMEAYAENFTTLTDDDADAYIKGRTEAEEALLRVRLTYMPVFRKVLSAKSAALFIQIDWRLDLLLDLQLASRVPLIEL